MSGIVTCVGLNGIRTFLRVRSSPEHSSRTILRVGNNIRKYEVNSVKYEMKSNYVQVIPLSVIVKRKIKYK